MIFAGGFSAYWDVPYSIFLRKKNQFDLLVSGFSLLFLVFAVLQHLFDTPQDQDAYGPAAFLGWPGRDHGLEAWNRITLALPSLRLFSAIGKIRVIWVCLAAILPRYSHVFTLWFVFMYGFGCVGCWLLAGRFRHLDESVYDMPQANFNSMLDSVTSLFQLFIGEAWNGVKQAAVDTRGGFIEAFFLVYILSMTVIFVNLMSGAPQTLYIQEAIAFRLRFPSATPTANFSRVLRIDPTMHACAPRCDRLELGSGGQGQRSREEMAQPLRLAIRTAGESPGHGQVQSCRSVRADEVSGQGRGRGRKG